MKATLTIRKKHNEPWKGKRLGHYCNLICFNLSGLQSVHVFRKYSECHAYMDFIKSSRPQMQYVMSGMIASRPTKKRKGEIMHLTSWDEAAMHVVQWGNIEAMRNGAKYSP